MPDHVHLCIDVHEHLSPGLSRAVASLMGMATKNLERSLCSHHNALSFFKKGFNDRIAYTFEQWYRQLAYIDDNPRRYLIKKMYPDLLTRRWLITIGQWQYMVIGNIMLLKNPDLQVVRYSSKYTPSVFDEKVKNWYRCVENNGVLVSPFIHPKENDLQKYALEQGGAVIRICENGFAERYTPQGRDFELTTAGRLLLIAPMQHNTHREFLTYTKAQGLNAVAERIAETNWLDGCGSIRPL